MDSISKMYYCCCRVFDKADDIEKVSSVLDSFISNKEYEEAKEFIKELNLQESKESVLLKCIDSYRPCC